MGLYRLETTLEQKHPIGDACSVQLEARYEKLHACCPKSASNPALIAKAEKGMVWF
jgi:hypothetical protein